jgi:hypothetical protein
MEHNRLLVSTMLEFAWIVVKELKAVARELRALCGPRSPVEVGVQVGLEVGVRGEAEVEVEMLRDEEMGEENSDGPQPPAPALAT